jgi:hypothetical protein
MGQPPIMETLVGARFNSAIRYVQYAIERHIPTVAIIVSEDGGIDIVPNPPPAIKRLLISKAVDQLELTEMSRIVGTTKSMTGC